VNVCLPKKNELNLLCAKLALAILKLYWTCYGKIKWQQIATESTIFPSKTFIFVRKSNHLRRFQIYIGVPNWWSNRIVKFFIVVSFFFGIFFVVFLALHFGEKKSSQHNKKEHKNHFHFVQCVGIIKSSWKTFSSYNWISTKTNNYAGLLKISFCIWFVLFLFCLSVIRRKLLTHSICLIALILTTTTTTTTATTTHGENNIGTTVDLWLLRTRISIQFQSANLEQL